MAVYGCPEAILGTQMSVHSNFASSSDTPAAR